MHGSIPHRRFRAQRSLRLRVLHLTTALATTTLALPLLSAQTTVPPGSMPSANHHEKPSAGTMQAPPAAAPAPNWPIDAQPRPASVTWNQQQLSIDASNSSLQQILKDIASETGSSIDGASKDERIFGTYGPAPARDVIAQLLQGTGYNVLLVGDQGQGVPRQIILSPRNNNKAAQGSSRPTPDESDEEYPQPEPQYEAQPMPPQQQQPPPPQALPQPMRPGFNPGVNGQPPQQQPIQQPNPQ